MTTVASFAACILTNAVADGSPTVAPESAIAAGAIPITNATRSGTMAGNRGEHMKLSELIAKYGDDAVQFQDLDHCAKDLNMNKGKTFITFGTEQPIGLNGTDKLGLVVWLDRAKVKEIVDADKAQCG
jgi:hypothetical protein